MNCCRPMSELKEYFENAKSLVTFGPFALQKQCHKSFIKIQCIIYRPASLLHIQWKISQSVKAHPLFEAHLWLSWVSIAVLVSTLLSIDILWNWYLQEVFLGTTPPTLSHSRAKLSDSGPTLSSWVTSDLSYKILPSGLRQELTLRLRTAPHE